MIFLIVTLILRDNLFLSLICISITFKRVDLKIDLPTFAAIFFIPLEVWRPRLF